MNFNMIYPTLCGTCSEFIVLTEKSQDLLLVFGGKPSNWRV